MPAKRRRFPFSIRALFLPMVLVGLYFGCLEITQRYADKEGLGGDAPAPLVLRRNVLIDDPPRGEVVCSQYFFWLFGLELPLPYTSDPAVARKASRLGRLTAEVAAQRSQGELVRVKLDRQTVTSQILHWLARLPDLQVLHLDHSGIDDAGLQTLSRSKSLRRLTLNHTELSDRGLEHLGRIETLEDLSLRAVNRQQPITDAGIAHLANLQRLWKLDLSANQGLTDAAMEPISQLPRLRWLNLWRTPIGGPGIEQLARCTTLQYLQLGGTRINDDDVRHLRSLTRLHTLALPTPGYTFVYNDQLQQVRVAVRPGEGVEGPGLEHLWGLPLEQLDYPFRRQQCHHWSGLTELRTLGPHVHLEGPDLVQVRRMRKLQQLEIRLTGGWHEARHLAMLRGMDQLGELTIGGRAAHDVSEAGPQERASRYAGLEVLGELPSLERLELSGIEDDALAHLAGCTALKTLDLRSSQVTGEGLKHLQAADRLQALRLNGRLVTDQGLARLRQLRSLRHLVLGDGARPKEGLPQFDRVRPEAPDAVAWSPNGLAQLSVLVNLQTLDLSGLPIGDREVAPLVRLPALQELHLGHTQVSDAGIGLFAGWLKTLHTLGLQHTQVGDEGILPLADLPQLRRLDIEGTEVSPAAAGTLYKARNRQCQISDNWCCGCMAYRPVGGP